MLLSEAFEAFEMDELIGENRSQSTINDYHDTLKSLTAAIGYDVHVELLTYMHVIAWKKLMHERGNALTYICANLRRLRRLLTYLYLHSISTLDAREIRIPKGAKPAKAAWLTVDQVGQFLSVIDNLRDLALFAMMFSSGARISMLLQLNKGSIVDGVARTRGKGEKEADSTLRFEPNVLKLLDNYLATRNDDHPALFLTRQHTRPTVKAAIGAFHKYIDKAGIELNGYGATHVLRHSFATDLDLSGLDILGIAGLMNHRKIDSTKRYIHSQELRRPSDYQKHHSPTPI